MSASISTTAQKDGYVVGVQNGKIYPRLDIDEFVLDQDVLNLFLLALIKLQDDASYTQPWSWFQISGIHGRPFTDWDNVGLKSKRGGASPLAGYCSHSSVTFPTWHRPYVAMMEQAVYVAMVDIAKQYTDPSALQKYLSACDRFRYPYWDPCLPRQTSTRAQFGVPKIVSSPTVYVRLPQNPGTLVPVDNPLFSFKFPTAVQPKANRDFLWGQSNNTLLRTGDGNTHTIRAPNRAGQTTDADINTYISSHIQSDIGGSLYKVLTANQTWGEFSNDRTEDGSSDRQGNTIFQTAEGFHDNIHGIVASGSLAGGYGHMGDIQFAAFDPIFWLHHCNVDRITALWQTKLGSDDPNSWWVEEAMGEQNWAVAAGTIQYPSDPLIPFRKSKATPGDETFWSSVDVRNWKPLGYNYLGRRIVRGASGRNELTTFPIDLDVTDSGDLNNFFGQFYSWMATGAPLPALLKQFYPLDLSKVEALTGKAAPAPAPAARIAAIAPQSAPLVLQQAKQEASVKMQRLPHDDVTKVAQLQASNPTPLAAKPVVNTLASAAGSSASKPSPPQAVISNPHTSPTPPLAVSDPTKPDYSHLEGLIKNGVLRQWNANIRVEKFALSGSFQVFVFIGDFSSNPDDWPLDPNLAGIDVIFTSNPASGGCSNCEQQSAANLLIADVIPLTTHLMKWIKSGQKIPAGDPEAVGCASLEPEHVLPFLTKNLHWRVANMQGEHHRRAEVAGLKLAVADQLVVLPKTFEDLLVFQDQTLHREVTNARDGGLNTGESFIPRP